MAGFGGITGTNERAAWPLGLRPRLDRIAPETVLALTLQRGRYGSPADVLHLEEQPAPRLEQGDCGSVLVAVLATGPNFNTNFASLGLPVPVFGRADPARAHIPGSDAVGIVIDAGAAVRTLRLGQAVILDSWTGAAIRGYETHDGFHAQIVRVPETQAHPVPSPLNDRPPETLAALLLTLGTAYRAVVERLGVRPGETVLVMGGGKGTSFFAAQLITRLGAKAILMGSNPRLMESLASRGFVHGWIDRRELPPQVFGPVEPDENPQAWLDRTEPFRAAVRRANGGEPVDKVFEHTGAQNFPLLVSVLRPRGALAFFGATGSGLKGEYRETFITGGRRFVFDARYVWMRQKQILFRSAPAAEVLDEIGLPPGRRVLVWGTEEPNLAYVRAALARSCSVVVIASEEERSRTAARLVEMGLSQDHVLRRESFVLPDDLPDPLLPEGRPNPEYDDRFLKPARAVGRALWQIWGNRENPDVVVEHPSSQTLHLSAFLARDFREDEVFPCGHVLVPGERNNSRDFSLRGSHMYSRSQAAEAIRLLGAGEIEAGEEDLEVVELDQLAELQEKMLRGRMEKPKGAALVQADGPGIPTGAFTSAYWGERVLEADESGGRLLGVDVLERVAFVRLNRTRALNALNNALLEQLEQLLTEVEADSAICGRPVEGMVLTGEGRAFMAGADVQGFLGKSPEEVSRLALRVNHTFSRLERLPIPVIAVINGPAFGGGNELALSAHVRVATENALFAQPEVKLGIFPGYGGMQRLPRLIGPRAAAELAVNGESIDARTALEIGLIHEVRPAATALRRGYELARRRPNESGQARTPNFRERDFRQELNRLLADPEVRALKTTPLCSVAEASDQLRARRAAAAQALQAITEGLNLELDEALERDSLRFGRIVASPGGQFWIERFLAKDPRQGDFLPLLPRQAAPIY
ncbi:MAG: hypothetical protein Kow00129_05410 [Thermoleophilia bacterium]